MLSAAKHLAKLQTNQSTMKLPPASIPRFFALAQNDNPPRCNAERPSVMLSAAKHLPKLQTNQSTMKLPPASTPRFFARAQNDNPPRCHAERPFVMLSAAKHLAELQTNQSTMKLSLPHQYPHSSLSLRMTTDAENDSAQGVQNSFCTRGELVSKINTYSTFLEGESP